MFQPKADQPRAEKIKEWGNMLKNNFYGRDILSIADFNHKDISVLFQKAAEMQKLVEKHGGDGRLRGKIMTALFYEPSSRTFGSFVSAMQRLGGGIIPLQGVTYSSVSKGETLPDTVRTFESFSDIIVIRHPEKGSAKIAAEYSLKPIINAGDGIGEHPTQAFLDAFTIFHHFPNTSKLTIGMVGDLTNGRTVHSLSQLLVLLGIKNFIFVSPKELCMPAEIVKKLKNKGSKIEETESLGDNISHMDVIYDTRVQKERFTDEKKYEELKFAYIINKKMMKKAKKSTVLMHPLPRVGEIATELDSDPRALYLREQMRNGMYIRMALLDLILNRD